MAIQVSCTCGKQMRVRDELAGKKVKCPGCAKVLLVREENDVADETPPKANGKLAQTGRPAAKVSPKKRPLKSVEEEEAPDDDEPVANVRATKKASKGVQQEDEEAPERDDESDEDERPKKKKKKHKEKSTPPYVLLAVAGAAVVAAAVVLVIVINSSGPEKKPSPGPIVVDKGKKDSLPKIDDLPTDPMKKPVTVADPPPETHGSTIPVGDVPWGFRDQKPALEFTLGKEHAAWLKSVAKLGNKVRVRGRFLYGAVGKWLPVIEAFPYDGPERAIPAAELTRDYLTNRELAAKKYQRILKEQKQDFEVVIEGTVAWWNLDGFLVVEGHRE